MKKTEFVEIKKMDTAVLKERAKKIKGEIAGLIIDKNMSKMPNLKSIKNKRNELAKILTVLKQKYLMEQLEKETVKKEKKENAEE